MLHRRRQDLVQSRAIFRKRRVRGDQVVLRNCQVALLQQHVRRRRGAQLQLLLFRIQALLRIVSRCQRRLHLRTIVGQRKLRIHDLHTNLRVKLRQPQLSLAILHQRPRLLRLRLSGCESESSC